VAIAFAVPRSSNHWLSVEASAPVVFICLSASFQEKESRQRRREREEKKTGRRKEKEASNTGERQTNADNGGLKKKGSPADHVSCLLFPAFACILAFVTIQVKFNSLEQ
jgi:hypothetical protein